MLLLGYYNKLSDNDLVRCIVEDNNKEAISYFLYSKCWNQLKYYVIRLYGNDEYLYDLINELYIKLQKDNWKSFREFKGDASLKTYICRIAYNLFVEKRKELIGFSEKTININDSPNDQHESDNSVEKRMQLLEIYDLISRLEPESYKVVMTMHLEGYSDEEIAIELTQRKIIHKQKTRDGKKIESSDDTISKDYVYTLRSRAIKVLKNTLVNK